jgi:hypothetical protein
MPTHRDSTYAGATGWHLDKRVQISHILATITCAAAVAAYVGQLKTDVELLKKGAVDQIERDTRQDSALRDSVAQLNMRLDRIESKLDRVIEDRRR